MWINIFEARDRVLSYSGQSHSTRSREQTHTHTYSPTMHTDDRMPNVQAGLMRASGLLITQMGSHDTRFEKHEHGPVPNASQEFRNHIVNLHISPAAT